MSTVQPRRHQILTCRSKCRWYRFIVIMALSSLSIAIRLESVVRSKQIMQHEWPLFRVLEPHLASNQSFVEGHTDDSSIITMRFVHAVVASAIPLLVSFLLSMFKVPFQQCMWLALMLCVDPVLISLSSSLYDQSWIAILVILATISSVNRSRSWTVFLQSFTITVLTTLAFTGIPWAALSIPVFCVFELRQTLVTTVKSKSKTYFYMECVGVVKLKMVFLILIPVALATFARTILLASYPLLALDSPATVSEGVFDSVTLAYKSTSDQTSGTPSCSLSWLPKDAVNCATGTDIEQQLWKISKYHEDINTERPRYRLYSARGDCYLALIMNHVTCHSSCLIDEALWVITGNFNYRVKLTNYASGLQIKAVTDDRRLGGGKLVARRLEAYWSLGKQNYWTIVKKDKESPRHSISQGNCNWRDFRRKWNPSSFRWFVDLDLTQSIRAKTDEEIIEYSPIAVLTSYAVVPVFALFYLFRSSSANRLQDEQRAYLLVTILVCNLAPYVMCTAQASHLKANYVIAFLYSQIIVAVSVFEMRNRLGNKTHWLLKNLYALYCSSIIIWNLVSVEAAA